MKVYGTKAQLHKKDQEIWIVRLAHELEVGKVFCDVGNIDFRPLHDKMKEDHIGTPMQIGNVQEEAGISYKGVI